MYWCVGVVISEGEIASSPSTGSGLLAMTFSFVITSPPGFVAAW